jgi:hypothetical protein
MHHLVSAMVNRHISDDLKMAALQLKARGHDTVTEILKIVCFSHKTFYNVQQQYHAVGSVAKVHVVRF